MTPMFSRREPSNAANPLRRRCGGVQEQPILVSHLNG
jgi:hypothetical protein